MRPEKLKAIKHLDSTLTKSFEALGARDLNVEIAVWYCEKFNGTFEDFKKLVKLLKGLSPHETP